MLPGLNNSVPFNTISEFEELSNSKIRKQSILEWVRKKTERTIHEKKGIHKILEDIDENLLGCIPIETGNSGIISILCQNKGSIEIEQIESVSTYLKDILDKNKFIKSYYRGQLANWKMIPSLFRQKEWIENEAELNARILSNRPDDFQNCNSFFEKLVVLKHFNQPSRLLDITTNPLIALFFACDYMVSHPDSIGVVNIVYSNDPDKEKYAIMSDTVKMLTALSNTKNKCKNCKRSSCTMPKDRHCNFIGELTYQLKQQSRSDEWNDLTVEKLDTCILVHPPMNNPRIVRQQGLFLMCGRNSVRNPSIIKKNNVDKETYSNNNWKNDVSSDLYSFFSDGQDMRKCYMISRNIYEDLLIELSVLGIDSYFVYGDLEKAIEREKSQMLQDIERRSIPF
ncbi:MAG: FRG domain-containing protein [Peptostreptococcaceae bacterium]|nr:FRG domain-containing protein [Peptostreptococcaceae bacterium]